MRREREKEREKERKRERLGFVNSGMSLRTALLGRNVSFSTDELVTGREWFSILLALEAETRLTKEGNCDEWC